MMRAATRVHCPVIIKPHGEKAAWVEGLVAAAVGTGEADASWPQSAKAWVGSSQER